MQPMWSHCLHFYILKQWVPQYAHKHIMPVLSIWQKPSAAPAKPTGTKEAAKSRLAAVKAAMKARQQAAEAEKAAKDAGKSEDDPSLNSQEAPAQAHMPDTVVFDGGFFQVESPAKTSGERTVTTHQVP